jgi:hypothetical protein
MPFTIEMTGAQDYQRMIKMALAGYPGSGKTLFSSTAPTPFFIFFREQPRIMSIAERYMAHVKVTNKYDSAGRLKTPVWDTLLEVVEYLESEKGDSYKTVVIDTGDELQQAMKEGKKAQNRGKWAIQDWGWLADMYREIVNRVVDMEKHVIVTYHLKQSQEGDDGEMFRELALQGAAKDEAGGWFDIVGVLDGWEETTDKGLKIPHRGILVKTTPRYPFVKDHSGKLGRLYELSDDFVGDFTRMHEIIYANVPTSEHEVIEEVVVETTAKPKAPKKTSTETGVPTPDDVKAKKEAKKKPPKKEAADAKAEEAPTQVEDAEAGSGTGASDGDQGQVEVQASDPAPEQPDQDTEQGDERDQVPATPPKGEADKPVDDTPPADDAEALDNVTEAFPDATVEYATCGQELEDGELCGKPLTKHKTDPHGKQVTSEGEPIVVPDRDLMDLTMIRFRKHMCREHFTAARKKG